MKVWTKESLSSEINDIVLGKSSIETLVNMLNINAFPSANVQGLGNWNDQVGYLLVKIPSYSISAVKFIRYIANLGIKDAKHFVEDNEAIIFHQPSRRVARFIMEACRANDFEYTIEFNHTMVAPSEFALGEIEGVKRED